MTRPGSCLSCGHRLADCRCKADQATAGPNEVHVNFGGDDRWTAWCTCGWSFKHLRERSARDAASKHYVTCVGGLRVLGGAS